MVRKQAKVGSTLVREKRLVSPADLKNLFNFLKICKKATHSTQPFKNATIPEINTLVKIIKLVLRQRLPIRKERLKKLKRYKNIFRKLVQTHNKDNLMKKKLVNQSGSGILSLLPIIGGVLSSIFTK